MAVNRLSPAAWKTFAKGKAYDDTAYVKALTVWQRADDAAPRDQIEALDELEQAGKQMLAAARAAKGGRSAKEAKALADWLDEAAEAIDDERRETAAEQAALVEDDHDFDNDLQALTTRLAVMLRMVWRGRTMHALVALCGSECAVRLSRRPLLPSARELLATYLGETGGVRYLPASCVWENAATTFIVEAPTSGLARQLRQALQKQTGTRHKVRVRGHDADQVDEAGDGADDEPDPAQAALAEQRSRLLALEPALKRALEAGRADANKLRALVEFASAKLQAGQTAAARRALDLLGEMIAAMK